MTKSAVENTHSVTASPSVVLTASIPVLCHLVMGVLTERCPLCAFFPDDIVLRSTDREQFQLKQERWRKAEDLKLFGIKLITVS